MNAESSGITFEKFIGIINSSEINQFKRMLFRITKGNLIMHFIDMQPIEIGKSQKMEEKSVYVLIYQSSSD